MPMDIRMSHETKPVLQQIFRQMIPTEQNFEMNLPDELPDLAEVVFTEAKAFLRGKEIDKGRILVKGIVSANILYYSDSASSIQKTEAQFPFAAEMACAEADETCKLIVTASVFSCCAKMMSSRRLLLKAETCISVRCFKELLLTTSCLPVDDCKDIQTRRFTESMTIPVSYSEKSFIVTDTFKLPGQCESISGLLLETARLTIDDAKIVGSKVVVKGSAFCDVLYNSDDSDLPCAVDFSSEFSQIIEMDRQVSDGTAEIVLALTGAYFHTEATLSSQERQIYLELHIAAQCITSTEMEVSYVTDAFSPIHDITLSRESIALPVSCAENKGLIEARGVLDVEDEIGKSLFSVYGAALPRISVGTQDSLLQIDLFLCSLHSDSQGKLKAVTGKITHKEDIDGTMNSASCFADCTGDIFIAEKGRGIDVRIPCNLHCDEKNVRILEIVNDIKISEENIDLSEKPSLVLHRYRKGESVWDLAKAHHSTSDLILSANAVEESGKYSDEQLIIIPKYRG